MIRYAQAALAALLINALLLLTASQLVRERPQVQDLSAPMAVSLVAVPQDDAPAETPDREPPPPPQRRPDPDFLPQLSAPSLVAPIPSGPVVRLDPTLFDRPAAAGPLIFEAEDLDRAPQSVVRTPPRYPFRARQRGLVGEVTVRFLVDVDGSVSRLTILSATPEGVFEEAVREAVPRWRFEPGTLEGEAVASWVVTSVVFDLDGGR